MQKVLLVSACKFANEITASPILKFVQTFLEFEMSWVFLIWHVIKHHLYSIMSRHHLEEAKHMQYMDSTVGNEKKKKSDIIIKWRWGPRLLHTYLHSFYTCFTMQTWRKKVVWEVIQNLNVLLRSKSRYPIQFPFHPDWSWKEDHFLVDYMEWGKHRESLRRRTDDNHAD